MPNTPKTRVLGRSLWRLIRFAGPGDVFDPLFGGKQSLDNGNGV